jgi:predicted metal-binding protein
MPRLAARSWRRGGPVSEPRLIVCTTCRAGRELADGETPQGALLHAELSRLVALAPNAVELREAACMANCERGCSVAIASPGKWTYVLGHLSPDHAADLLTYAAAYAATSTGTVMPSRRPASLGRAVLARVPHLEFAA